MKRVAIFLTLLGLILASCAPARAPAASAPMEAPAAGAPAAGEPQTAALDQDLGAMPRMIVRRAELSLVVQDATGAIESIRQMAESMGGYVAGSNAYRVSEQMQANVTIRVPAAELNNVLEQLRRMAVRVERENISGEDMTEEYTDIASRLRNLEATEQELLALLREVRERPNATAEDILNVHRRVTEVRQEIEQLKGRQQYLDNVVALATIIVELIPDELASPVVAPGWRPLQTLRDAFRALVRALQWLVDLVIWIVVFVLPILILVAFPLVLLVLAIQWIRRRQK